MIRLKDLLAEALPNNVICMKCKKELGHKAGLRPGEVSHGLCAKCEDEYNKEIDRMTVDEDSVHQTTSNWRGKGCKNYDDARDVCLDNEGVEDDTAKQETNILDMIEFYKRATDEQRTTLENFMDAQKYAEAKRYMDSINYGNFPQNAYQGWAGSRKGAS